MRVMEVKVHEAIDRYEAMTGMLFKGQFHHLRWAMDGDVYCWEEFREHYKSVAKCAWDSAEPVIADDGSFCIPEWLRAEERDRMRSKSQ